MDLWNKKDLQAIVQEAIDQYGSPNILLKVGVKVGSREGYNSAEDSKVENRDDGMSMQSGGKSLSVNRKLIPSSLSNRRRRLHTPLPSPPC